MNFQCKALRSTSRSYDDDDEGAPRLPVLVLKLSAIAAACYIQATAVDDDDDGHAHFAARYETGS